MSLWSNTIISLPFNPAEGVLKRLRFPAIIARLISHVTPVRQNTGMDRRSIIPEHLRTHQQHMRIKQLKVRGREGGGEEEESLVFKCQQTRRHRSRRTTCLCPSGVPRSLPPAQITAPASRAPPPPLLFYVREKLVSDVMNETLRTPPRRLLRAHGRRRFFPQPSWFRLQKP